MPKDRAYELTAATLLIAVHVVVLLLFYGTETASVWGDWFGAAAALLAAVSCWVVSRRAGPFGKRVWRLVSYSAFLALIGQVLYTYYYDYLHALDQLASWDVLVFFWAVPALTSLFLSPRDANSGFRWLRACDFVQVCTLVLAYELAGVYVPSQWQAAGHFMQGRVLSVGLIFFGLVTVSFLVRSRLTPFQTARRLFQRLAAFFFVFAITTNSTLYALTSGAYRQGIWPDLSWTVTYCLLAVLAATWNDSELSEEKAPRSRGAELLSQFSPLILPAIVFPLVFSIARERLLWAALLGMVSFAAASVRLFLVQNQLLLSSRHLKDNLALLRSIIEGTTDVIFVRDLKGRYLMVNSAGARNLGRRVEEVIGKVTAEMFSPENCRRIAAHDRTVLKSGSAQTFEEFLVLAGVSRVYLTTKAPYRDSDGQIIGLLGIARDITDRKLAEEEFRQSQQRLRIHFERTPLAVVEWDTEFRVVAWNSSAERIFGYSCQEALGQHGSFVFPPQDGRQRDQVWQELLSQKGGNRSTIENITKDRRTISCEWDNTPLVDASGRVLGVASLVQDVTERVAVEQKLRQSQKMEAVGRLAGGIAHDFNNLLTVINGYSQLMLNHDGLPDQSRRQLDQIHQAGVRAGGLTQQLLAFSRQQVFMPRSVNMNDAVLEIVSMLEPIVGEDICITTSLAPDLGFTLVDPDQMHQVLMNLTLNARDAMPHGGDLRIETSNRDLGAGSIGDHPDITPGAYVQLAVSDSGAGMDAPTREKIFEPFFTTKSIGGGTGLGLAMVHGIVRQSGGWIFVDSGPGEGTTFKIYLPRIASPAIGEKALRVDGHTLTGQETILVVEDNQAVREFTVELLRDLGYRVLKAANGEEALRLAGREKAIDLMITDVVMPGMTGPQLANHLQTVKEGIRVLYASGYAEDVVIHRGVVQPGFQYISKPFSPEALAAKVREVLA